MIMVCNVMGMSMIRMHYVDDIFMGMAVFFDLSVMICHDL